MKLSRGHISKNYEINISWLFSVVASMHCACGSYGVTSTEDRMVLQGPHAFTCHCVVLQNCEIVSFNVCCVAPYTFILRQSNALQDVAGGT